MNAIEIAALKILARRDHSYQELYRKLLQKGFEPVLIEEALGLLSTQHLLDEQRFISSFVRYRRQQGFGPLKITADLQAKGVATQDLQQNLEWQNSDWLTIAQDVWEKKFSRSSRQKTTPQQARFLQQRGFNYQTIYQVLNQTPAEDL